MKNDLFNMLVESVREAGAILRGERRSAMSDVRALVDEARRSAEEAGLTPEEIAQAIQEVRDGECGRIPSLDRSASAAGAGFASDHGEKTCSTLPTT